MLTLVSLVAILGLAGTQASAQNVKPLRQAQDRPNIVFFITDDYGWQDTSEPMWTEQTKLNKIFCTPNMESLADQGVKFTNANTACSVCEGSRISILTGQNPVRHGTTFITGKHGYGKNSKTLKSAKQDIEGIQQGSKYREGN